MELQFWGVRGSIPVPGTDTLKIGGNTTCVSIEHQGYTLVFDAGTGIRGLGQHLDGGAASTSGGCIFLSHYHWDHIQGLPFFAPAFRAENRFHLFGERKKGVDLQHILAEQMQTPYFPVSMDAQAGLVTFNEITAGQTLDLSAGLSVQSIRLNHPSGAVGFRIECADGSVCIVTDHEHSDGGVDAPIVEFAKGADILIHEAPYSPEERRGPRKGWGHSSWEDAALTAKAAEVGTLYLSHHDHERSDDEIFQRLDLARRVFEATEIATESTKRTLSRSN
ncbi:MAG: MBL fold metallo-hydrolase [Alphaproteobacteria bacterium]|nr:MBL fold metallo-hydrolase [Alphaproteobacteria bacterium]